MDHRGQSRSGHASTFEQAWADFEGVERLLPQCMEANFSECRRQRLDGLEIRQARRRPATPDAIKQWKGTLLL
jgi:hypothetical protein